MIWLYRRTGSPTAIARVATLWPGGTRPTMVTSSSSSFVPPTSCWRAMTTSSAGCSRIVSDERVSIGVSCAVCLFALTALGDRCPGNRGAIDGGMIPLDAEAGCGRRQRVPVVHRESRRRDRIELRDVLDPRTVGHGGRQRHVQFHQEMRTHGDVERF